MRMKNSSLFMALCLATFLTVSCSKSGEGFVKGQVEGTNYDVKFKTSKAYFDSYPGGKKYLSIEGGNDSHEVVVIVPLPINLGQPIPVTVIPETPEGQTLTLEKAAGIFEPVGKDPIFMAETGTVTFTKYEGKVGGEVEAKFELQAPYGVLSGSVKVLQGSDVVESGS